MELKNVSHADKITMNIKTDALNHVQVGSLLINPQWVVKSARPIVQLVTVSFLTIVFNVKTLLSYQIMGNVLKNVHQDMLKMDFVLVIRNAMIRVADYVVQMDSVINVSLIIMDNHHANGNNYFHHCLCHSSLHLLLYMQSFQQSFS